MAEFTEIESGKRANPRPSTLRKLAQALEVEVADLYGDLESPLAKAPPSQDRLAQDQPAQDHPAQDQPGHDKAGQDPA